MNTPSAINLLMVNGKFINHIFSPAQKDLALWEPSGSGRKNKITKIYEKKGEENDENK